MSEQTGNSMVMQFIEVDQVPQDMEVKRNSHIAFLSDDPKRELGRIQEWVESKGHKFLSGGWSDREFYFDCPDVFIDFVIEVMHTSVAEE